MACASQSMISANSSAFPFQRTLKRIQNKKERSNLFLVRDSTEETDCNVEECAPDKEVGKVSMEWLAGEKTKVVGTFPPRRKAGWTGYVEKDTAGQTNIYSVEPAVYVAESAISSGNAGTSAEGAENTAAIAAGLAFISIAAASSILLQVGRNTPPQAQTLEYSGPSLSYYVNKFKPEERIEASVPLEPENSIPSETAPGVPQVSVESQSQAQVVDSNVSNSS